MASQSKQSTKQKTQPKRLVLLDAHAILHRAYHALPQFATSSGEPTGALYGLSTILIKLIDELKPVYMIACYDLPEPTHRHQVYEEYKSGRSKADDELVDQIKNSREIFQAFGIPTYEAPGFEADDLLGTITAQLTDRNDLDIVIASGDMDTLQLVDGKHVQVYTMKRGIQDTVMYDKKAVQERFGFTPEHLVDFKGLSGDSSDNIPGVSGIGEKTATQLIQGFGHIEDIYKALEKDPEKLKKKGIKDRAIKLLQENKDEAEFSKMLATIRLDAPIEFTLPEAEWGKGVDFDRTREIFQRFEFRNLESRLRQAVGGESEEDDAADKEESSEHDQVDSHELQKTAIALWLVKSDLTNPTHDDILSYANVSSFEEAKEIIFQELQKRGLESVFSEIEEPLIPLVEKMTKRGISINRGYLQELSDRYHHDLSSIEKDIYEKAGHEFNINSPKQLGEVLFDELGLSVKNHKKTSTGARSTKESELRKLEGEPIIDLILQHRELSKLLGTYIDAIPPMLDDSDRLHAEFLQAGTTTGRMASQNPNLQNIPIRTELGRAIRDAFVASDGYTLLSLDYSQIELRVAAILSGDEKLIAAFKDRRDIHQTVAAEVFEVDPNKVDKEMRRKAKVINFGIIYGMGVNALQHNLGTSRGEAQQFYTSYFEKFSGLAEYLEGIKEIAHKQGYTETLFGRRRYFEGIDSHLPYIRAGAERMAINAPIQGTAADVLKIAMVRIDQKLGKQNNKKPPHLLLQVHDELVFEVPTDSLNDVADLVKSEMEGVLSPEKARGVPLTVEAESGPNWGSLEPIEVKTKS